VNGLRIATELGIRWLEVHGDSQLVIDQVMKDSSCHDPKMAAYCREVRRLEDKFNGLELIRVPRWDNKAADTLVNMASGREPVLAGVFASNQLQPSIRYGESGRVGKEPPAQGMTADPSPSGADLEEAPATFVVMAVDEDPAAEPDPQAD
jgi:hypothetical protein